MRKGGRERERGGVEGGRGGVMNKSQRKVCMFMDVIYAVTIYTFICLPCIDNGISGTLYRGRKISKEP